MVKKLLIVATLVLLGTSSMEGQFNHRFDENEAQRLADLATHIEKMLVRYQELPGATHIAKAFKGKIRVTKFVTDVPGGEASLLLSRTPQPNLAGTVEIVIFDKEHLRHRRINGKRLFYDAGWRAIFCIDTLTSDTRWFDALVMHELVHAYHDRTGSASTHAPMWSDTWIEEEVEAHDLERNVLIRATNGEYGRALEEAIRTAPMNDVGKPLLSESTTARLKRVFKPENEHDYGFREAQHRYDFFAFWIEKTHSVLEWPNQKKSLYRSLVGQRN